MTEKEKMLNSQMYNPMGDKQLRNERCSVKNLCREYNNLPFEDEETQKILIKKIVGSTKENFYITAPFWCDYGYNIELGENFYSNHNMVILDCAKVKFGDNVLLHQTADFIRQVILLIIREETQALNMPIRLPSATMCGLAEEFRSCRASQSEVML